MAASITLYLFGKAIAKQMTIDQPAAFYWGVQGEPAIPLTALPQTQIQRSFMLGQQVHTAFSRQLFPYIIGKAEFVQTLLPEQPEEVVLQEVCSALDTVMLRRECGLLPSDFDFSLVFPQDGAVLREISAFAADVSGKDPDMILEDLQQKAKRFCKYRDRTTLKKLWYLRREKNGVHLVSCHIRPMTEDPEWDVAGMEEGPDFFTLFDRTVEKFASAENKNT